MWLYSSYYSKIVLEYEPREVVSMKMPFRLYEMRRAFCLQNALRFFDQIRVRRILHNQTMSPEYFSLIVGIVYFCILRQNILINELKLISPMSLYFVFYLLSKGVDVFVLCPRLLRGEWFGVFANNVFGDSPQLIPLIYQGLFGYLSSDDLTRSNSQKAVAKIRRVV